MKKFISCFLILLSIHPWLIKSTAQDGKSVFNYLRFPTSARVSALGGTNVSVIENDPSLVFQNPGFLGGEMDNSLNINYMSYLADISAGSIIYTKASGERGAWGAGVNYLDYGDIKEAGLDGIVTGNISVKDICFNGFYAHDLTETLRGGIALKFIYSSFDEVSSTGLGVDLGITYYNRDNEFSFGLAAKNLGGQLTAYYETRYAMPWDIQMGITKKLSNAPIRFSITMPYLNKWKFYDLEGNKQSNFEALLKHFIFGIDILPSDNFWIAVGYNVKTGTDMSLDEGNKMGGFSAGAGIRVKSFEVGAAVAKYHPAATSFLLSLTTFFSQPSL